MYIRIHFRYLYQNIIYLHTNIDVLYVKFLTKYYTISSTLFVLKNASTTVPNMKIFAEAERLHEHSIELI